MYIYIFVGEKSWRAGHYIWQWHGLHGAVGLVWYWGVSLSGQPREDCSSLGGQWWTGGSLQSYSSPLGLPWQLPLWLLFIDSSSFFFGREGGGILGAFWNIFWANRFPSILTWCQNHNSDALYPRPSWLSIRRRSWLQRHHCIRRCRRGWSDAGCLVGYEYQVCTHTHTDKHALQKHIGSQAMLCHFLNADTRLETGKERCIELYRYKMHKIKINRDDTQYHQ